MRTTLTIDDDILAEVRHRAQREGRTAGAVLSDLARGALVGSRSHASTERSGFPLLPARGVIVTADLVNSLIDEDEL
ncbi:MAG: CopG family transcriptional regulator [bacterium]|nr:CopG family transcriptional regulator [bacterium]